MDITLVTHVCSRCERPVAEVNGEWRHMELADAVFCDVVMRAAERAAKMMGITKAERTDTE